MAMLESEMENELIKQLSCDVSQWRYRKDLKCEDDLWNNLRQKLNNINIDKLNGVPLTDGEMEQVKNFICDVGSSTYKAARWLAGEHRVAQIEIIRDDPKEGKVNLTVINSRDIAGGTSSYEVINQYRSPVDNGSSRSRRFDVTLLINGLPLIHIELKNSDHPDLDAYRQIVKYVGEGKFRGLMGLVQMFVVSNGGRTRYIAANIQGCQCNMNESFLTGWVDENNVQVGDYLAFAKSALNIPLAHQMIGKYSVLDNESKKLILLRPYQIHAIEAIRKASRERRSGFIWHTTGSGKTLTSYTVTKNLLDIPTVDKAIFLIDRKDLDQQTSTAFQSYADSDDIDVRNTENTGDLERKLKNKDRCAIVTTIQKLQTIIRRCIDKNASAEYSKLKDQISKKQVAFVVDECHRAVTPETKNQIDSFFQKSLWYGFTGTPIFAENKRAEQGNLARTTAEQYCSVKNPTKDDLEKALLHSYTIKEAIKDKAVLGFMIQGLGFRRDTLENIAKQLKIYTDEEIAKLSDKDLEVLVVKGYAKATGKNLYEDDRHRDDVIDYIINKSFNKFRLNANNGEAYEAILTVQSIAEAQIYYKRFKQFVKDGKVNERVRMSLPDFPKVAITYTVGENEDGAMVNQAEMKASLDDYNAMFGTSWDLSTIGGYNAELTERLARKRSKYKNRAEQLDLVIVVDRLLTGFDAPCLATIFLDRPPMKPQHLIQAFSRTNRLFDKHKQHGNVVTLQTPEIYKEAIDHALRLYSNGSTADVQVPTWEESVKRLQEAIKKFGEVVATPDDALQLSNSGTKEELSRFIKAYQELDRRIASIRVYDEFDETKFMDLFSMSLGDFELYTAHYHNAIERLKTLIESEGDDTIPINIDLEYQLETIREIEVNFKYLVALLQSHMPEASDSIKAITPEEDKRITKLIENFSKTNERIGAILGDIWMEIKFNPEAFRDQDAYTIVTNRAKEAIENELIDFATKWGVNPVALRAYATVTPTADVSPKTVDTSMGDFAAYKAQGGTGNKLVYLKKLRQQVAEFVLNKIKPLMTL